MTNLLIGAAVGFFGGYVVKGQTSKAESVSDNGTLYSTLYNNAQVELNRLKSALQARDSEIDALNQKIKGLTKKLRDGEDEADDRADDLEDMRKTIESLRHQNEDMNEKMADYKSLYLAAQQEIERLKGR